MEMLYLWMEKKCWHCKKTATILERGWLLNWTARSNTQLGHDDRDGGGFLIQQQFPIVQSDTSKQTQDNKTNNKSLHLTGWKQDDEKINQVSSF